MNSFICNNELQNSPLRDSGPFIKINRSFYDKWSVCESTRFKADILSILKFDPTIAHNTDYQSNAVEWLDGLGNVDYSLRNDGLLVKELLARGLFSKDEDLLSQVNKPLVAMKAFLQAEESCRDVNRNFRYSFSPSMGDFPKDIHSILYVAGRKIEEILGPVPSLHELPLSFGPGATSTTSGKTSARYKLSSKPSISASLLPHLEELQELLPLWFKHYDNAVEVTNSRLEFVPKNYKTFRAIGVEPSVNTMCQKAYGEYIRKRLKAINVDLQNQDINKERARLGSINGDVSTLDLERASDSISYGLVLNLLPKPWFDALDACRTSHVDVTDFDNKVITVALEKFSSMGNGYTFELESMIFYALGFAVAQIRNLPFDLTVYGDDLVCNNNLASELIKFFPFVGFIINQEKSFIDGDFRESCGGDYLKGIDIRPFFVRRRMSYDIVVSYFNFLQRKPWFDPDYHIRSYFLSVLPDHFKIWGPDGFGDGHLIDFDYVPVPHGRQYGYGGFSFTTFTQVPYSEQSDKKEIGDGLYPTSKVFADNYVPGDDLVMPYLASVNQFETYLLPCSYDSLLRRRLTSARQKVAYSLREYALAVEAESNGSSILSLRKPMTHKVKARKIKVYYFG